MKRKIKEPEGHEANKTKQHRCEESYGGQTIDHVDETCKVPFLTTELVGEAFQINKQKILDCLKKNEVLSIGIYGMGGGIGKTTLMKNVYNRLFESYLPVSWITVPHDFSTVRLQKLIAEEIKKNKIKLDLSNEYDTLKRAAVLSNALENNQNHVLILDNLWNHFDLNEVGLPIRANGCKLIVTTRSLDICKKMLCQEIIAINLFTREEEWTLFQKPLGDLPSSGIIEIAKSITWECGGLPLAIETMAASMRPANDISEWSNTLRELKQSEVEVGDKEEKVFRILRFSYNRLNDPVLQQCFLYCALFPEDKKIEREELIEYLIDEEVIEGESRQEKYDKGHTMLNRLERVCLLEGFKGKTGAKCVKMHDFFRDMAIQIMKTDGRVMVKAGVQLVEIPDYRKWGVELIKVSLMYNNIEEIPSNHSPRRPNLSTLLLCGNESLTRIANSFFEQLNGLKILDISDTSIYELPATISHLVHLNALVLRRCYDLKQVPSLALLTKLKKLDLFQCTAVKSLPQGMEMLSDLEYIDLRSTGIKELSIGIYPNLSHLQVLLVHSWLEGKKLRSLMKLEVLVCTFPDIGEFKIFTTSIPLSSLNRYILYIESTAFLGCHQWIVERQVYFVSKDLCGEDVLLPQNAEILEFHNCNIKKRGLCLKNATELKKLRIDNCNGIECLLSLSSSSSIFQSLEEIYIENLRDLCFLFSGEDDVAPPPPPPPTIPLSVSLPHSSFSLLKTFYISDCSRMKLLFPPCLVSNLQNLETLKIKYCDEITEIFAMEEGQESHGSNCGIQFFLPKLKSLELINLPQLKSICRGKIICNSLTQITVIGCKRLKRMPVSLVLMENTLETLIVGECDEMKEIFAMEGQESLSNGGFFHPKLTVVVFPNFPQLKRICRGNIISNSLRRTRRRRQTTVKTA